MTQVRETVSFKAGDVILYPGVPGPRDRAYRVLEGLVRLEAVDEEGNALTLRLVRPGGFFGEEALFGQERIYFAEAATDVRLEPLPENPDPELLKDLAQHLSQTARSLSSRGTSRHSARSSGGASRGNLRATGRISLIPAPPSP